MWNDFNNNRNNIESNKDEFIKNIEINIQDGSKNSLFTYVIDKEKKDIIIESERENGNENIVVQITSN